MEFFGENLMALLNKLSKIRDKYSLELKTLKSLIVSFSFI